MKVPPRVRRVVEEEARWIGRSYKITDWGRAGPIYVAVYELGPRPVGEESQVIEVRWIAFDKSDRVHYSGIVDQVYGWREIDNPDEEGYE